MLYEYAFEMSASTIRFGPGVTREIGMDLAELKVQRALVVTDPVLAKLPPVAAVVESLDREKVPNMLLEIEEKIPGEAQLLTRFESFIEMMRS